MLQAASTKMHSADHSAQKFDEHLFQKESPKLYYMLLWQIFIRSLLISNNPSTLLQPTFYLLQPTFQEA